MKPRPEDFFGGGSFFVIIKHEVSFLLQDYIGCLFQVAVFGSFDRGK